MSLWQADDYSTKTIVTDFFSHLKAGLGKDEALCRAQRDVVRNTSEEVLTHPYYWSTLMLMGDGAPLSGSGVPVWMWLAGIGLLVGMGAFYFLWRKKIKHEMLLPLTRIFQIDSKNSR